MQKTEEFTLNELVEYIEKNKGRKTRKVLGIDIAKAKDMTTGQPEDDDEDKHR